MRWLVGGAMLCFCTQSGFGEEPAVEAGKCLTVLSTNVGIFPRHLVALYPASLKEKKKEVIADEEERAGLLSQKLRDCEGDPDVVLLQEIWSIKARDRLIKDLAPEYPYCKHPSSIGAGAAAMQASGLIVFSKYPLKDFAFKEFSRGFGGDKAARKGIVGVRLTTAKWAGGKRRWRDVDEGSPDFGAEWRWLWHWRAGGELHPGGDGRRFRGTVTGPSVSETAPAGERRTRQTPRGGRLSHPGTIETSENVRSQTGIESRPGREAGKRQ